jgi:hypothetical protein
VGEVNVGIPGRSHYRDGKSLMRGLPKRILMQVDSPRPLDPAGRCAAFAAQSGGWAAWAVFLVLGNSAVLGSDVPLDGQQLLRGTPPSEWVVRRGEGVVRVSVVSKVLGGRLPGWKLKEETAGACPALGQLRSGTVAPPAPVLASGTVVSLGLSLAQGAQGAQGAQRWEQDGDFTEKLVTGPLRPGANERELNGPRGVEESRHARLPYHQNGRQANSAARGVHGRESGDHRWAPGRDPRLAVRVEILRAVGAVPPARPRPEGRGACGGGPRDTMRERCRREHEPLPSVPEAPLDSRRAIRH